MGGRTLPLGFIATMLLILGMLAALMGRIPPAAPARNPSQNNVVISEFRSGGPNAGHETADDFVEIFNPTSSSIDIGGWLIKSVDITGSMVSLFMVPAGTTLTAGQHLLVVGYYYSGAVSPDGRLVVPGGIVPVDGGVALTLGDGTVMDLAGMSAASSEGMPLPALAGNLDESYERKPGGLLGSCYDSNDNLFDFSHIAPSSPQNSDVTTPPTVCAAATAAPPPPDTPTSSSTFTGSLTNTYTSSPTKTSSPTRTFTPASARTNTPAAPGNLVISEFRSHGPNGEADEFVELFNPTGGATNIGSWTIQYSSGCGSVVAVLATIPNGTVLLAGQHYLMASSSNSSIGPADLVFPPALTNDGGLALVNVSGQIQDQAGTCISTLFREGTNLPPLQGSSNQSYERRPGGATACYDTNNNSGDFVRILPANPQKQADGIMLCTGVLTSTPTRTGIPTRTATSARLATSIPDLVVINEFLPWPQADWNNDGAVNEGDEFIEIVNRGTRPINLANWKLSNANNEIVFTLPDVFISPANILVFFHSETGIPLPDSGGTVRLVKSNGQTGDIFRYGPVEAPEKTWCRLTDRNNGSLGFFCQPTPGNTNLPFNPALAPTAISGSDGGSSLVCGLADSVPAAIVSAECGGFGAGIWNALPRDIFTLPSHGKWEVFIE